MHSLLANLQVKKYLQIRFPALTENYRIYYNIMALVTLLPIVTIVYVYPGSIIWEWPNAIISNLILLLAIFGFLNTLKYYSGREFLGLGIPKEKSNDQKPELSFSPSHRIIRHPLYFYALIIIWSRDLHSSYLIVALIFTFYFFIGGHLEDKKLVQQYGPVYQLYIAKVPGIIPRPRKFLNKNELNKLSKLLVLLLFFTKNN